MTHAPLQTPIVLVAFNRPAVTRRVFHSIREARPRQLFVIADGPRPDHPEDKAQVAETRAILETIDWPCEVVREYAEENLGCLRRVGSGLDRVFATVEEAII